MAQRPITKLPAIILAGGLGSRLKPILPDTPKVLATVNRRAFVEFVVADLRRQGILKIILSTGHLHHKIKQHFTRSKTRLTLKQEPEPLGTGGAIKFSAEGLTGEHFFTLNGDSFCAVDLPEMFDFHKKNNSLMTIALSANTRSDGGKVKIGKNGKILALTEKNARSQLPLINAGVYIFKKNALKFFPRQKKFSLEYDVFPKLIKTAPCFGFVSKSEVVDIGTPERLAAAGRKIQKLWTKRKF